MLDKETVCSRNLHNFKHKLLLTNLSRYLKGEHINSIIVMPALPVLLFYK